MKKMILVFPLILSGCLGYSAKDSSLIGQVKKAEQATPLICPDYKTANLSLGVMVNGVGSMSTHDEWVSVLHDEDYKLLSQASITGTLVKITYNKMRGSFCTPRIEVTHAELVK